MTSENVMLDGWDTRELMVKSMSNANVMNVYCGV